MGKLFDKYGEGEVVIFDGEPREGLPAKITKGLKGKIRRVNNYDIAQIEWGRPVDYEAARSPCTYLEHEIKMGEINRFAYGHEARMRE